MASIRLSHSGRETVLGTRRAMVHRLDGADTVVEPARRAPGQHQIGLDSRTGSLGDPIRASPGTTALLEYHSCS
jgi:hypothetical protein